MPLLLSLIYQGHYYRSYSRYIIIAVHVVAACKLKALMVGGFEQNYTGKTCHWVNPESHLHAHVYMYVHV